MIEVLSPVPQIDARIDARKSPEISVKMGLVVIAASKSYPNPLEVRRFFNQMQDMLEALNPA